MEGWRAAAALLLLAATIGTITSAPLDEQTALDVYDGESSDGCYYNFQHYGEGDRIMTNEPCLNCTCHNRMLMCYLRVCPFTKPIGQDCSVEKRGDQCCPVITCPDVPVDLLTSTSTALPSDSTFTDVGHLDKFGCSIDGRFYAEGSKVPALPNKPCELCYCIRNMTACVMQECTLHVDGCTPVYNRDSCCPVRYSCDHPDEDLLQLDELTTTVRPTPGFMLTTTVPPGVTQDCIHDENIYADGALIKTEKACEHCYCMKGDIVCVVQECGAPMENEGKNCTALVPREGQCCPDTYICEGDDESSTARTSTELTEITTISDEQFSITDELPQKEVPVHDKHPDEQNQIPEVQQYTPQEAVTQSSNIDIRDEIEKLETGHIFTTEAITAPVEEFSSSVPYGENENTVPTDKSTGTEQEDTSTGFSSAIPESTTVFDSQTSPSPDVDTESDTRKTEKNPETEITSTPEHSDETKKTTKGNFDHFTGITTKSLPDFPTKSDVDIIGDNVYTTHINPSYNEETVTVTESNIIPNKNSMSTSTENTFATTDNISGTENTSIRDLPQTQSEDMYDSSSETDISTRIFTSKVPSQTTPIFMETFGTTISDEISLFETTPIPLYTEQSPTLISTLEEKLPATSTSRPEIVEHVESITNTALVTEQNKADDITTTKIENTSTYDFTTVPIFETTLLPVTDTHKLEEHSESTTLYVQEIPSNSDSDKLTTLSNISELPTTSKIDSIEYTTLAPTTAVDNINNEIHEDEREPISPQIPGEGDCLVDGITYINDSIIPNANKCVISCRCVSSIVHCDQVACNPPPADMINCEPIDDGKDSCCPIYACDQSKQTLKPESDSQMSEFTSTYTSDIIDDITTTPLSIINPSIQGLVNKFQNSQNTTSIGDVSCDSAECNTNEDSKPTIQPIEELNTVEPQSIDEIPCDSAECNLSLKPQKPIQGNENVNIEIPVASGCSGNDCRAETESSSIDFTTSSIILDITTPSSDIEKEKPIDGSLGAKPCESTDCTIQDQINTSVEISSSISPHKTESSESTTTATDDCNSGNCKNLTTVDPSVTDIQEECKSADCKTERAKVPTIADECAGDNCQVIPTITTIEPIACTSEDCRTESDTYTPEPATIKPTVEEVKPCNSADCHLATNVVSSPTSPDCTSSDCQLGQEENTEQPDNNEVVCTSENCKYPEKVPVSLTPMDSSSKPEISDNEENVNIIPDSVSGCTTPNCSSQEVTVNPLLGEQPIDSKCDGENCAKVPIDGCSSPDCGTQDVTGSTVTSSNNDMKYTTASPVTLPDIGAQEISFSVVTSPDSDTQDITGSPVTFTDLDTQDITPNPDSQNEILDSDSGNKYTTASPVASPDSNDQEVTISPVTSSNSDIQDITGSPTTSSDHGTQDVTESPETELKPAEIECTDNDCVKVDTPECSSPECVLQDIATTPLPEKQPINVDCSGDDCVKLPASTCLTSDCKTQDVATSPTLEDIPEGLNCNSDDCMKNPVPECSSPDCASVDVTGSPVIEESPVRVECNGDSCVKEPPECSSSDCGSHEVTATHVSNVTPTGVECDGEDCVKVSQSECISPDCNSQDDTASVVTKQPDDLACVGDDCFNIQKPECLSSDCDFQNVPASSKPEVKPTITECEGDDCVKIDTLECSSSNCAPQDGSSVPESQSKPNACKGDECVNVQVPECTSSNCANSDDTPAVPEVKPVACHGEECEILTITESPLEPNKEELPKLSTEHDVYGVTTESSETNMESSPDKNRITPAIFESDSTTPVVQEPKPSTPSDDIYITTLSQEIPKTEHDIEKPSIDQEKTTQTIPELINEISTVHYENENILEDKISTTPQNTDVIQDSEISIDAGKTTDKPYSDLYTTNMPEHSYSGETQATTPASDEKNNEEANTKMPDRSPVQELGTFESSSQVTDGLLSEEVERTTPVAGIPVAISSTDISEDQSHTTIPSLEEQPNEGSIIEPGVTPTSNDISDVHVSTAYAPAGETQPSIESETVTSLPIGTSTYPIQHELTTAVLIQTSEQDDDSNGGVLENEISSTVRLPTDVESQTEISSNLSDGDVVESSQTTHSPLLSTTSELDVDKSQVSPVTPETTEPVLYEKETSTVGDVQKITNSPLNEQTTSATFEISTKSEIADGTEKTTDKLPSEIVQDTTEYDDNQLVTATEKLESDKPEKSPADSSQQDNVITTIEPETSTEFEKNTKESTYENDIINEVSTPYSPIESVELSQATTARLPDMDIFESDHSSGSQELTSTTLPPVQSIEIVKSETKIPDTTESVLGITLSPTTAEEQDITETSIVMSGSVSPAAELESGSLVTSEINKPDIGLITIIPNLETASTSEPTIMHTDKPNYVDENKPIIEEIAPVGVEVPIVNEVEEKPIDDGFQISTLTPTTITQTVASVEISSDEHEHIESSTLKSEESVVPVSPLTFNTEMSSVPENEVTPVVYASTAEPAFESQTKIVSELDQTTTHKDEYLTSPTFSTETEKQSGNADKTETSDDSLLTMSPENIANILTTSPMSIVFHEEQTTSYIVSTVSPILDITKDISIDDQSKNTESTPESTFTTSKDSVTPVSKDDDNVQITSKPETSLYNTELPKDSEHLTTTESEEKITSVEINTPVSTVYEISTVPDTSNEPGAGTSFDSSTKYVTTIGEDNKLEITETTTYIPFENENLLSTSGSQAIDHTEEPSDTKITTSTETVLQDNRFEPVNNGDTATTIPKESVHPTEENVSILGGINTEYAETTPYLIIEKENAVVTDIPLTIDVETSPSITTPEVTFEGSGDVPQPEIVTPLYTESSTINTFESNTPELVPENVSVGDSDHQPEFEITTQINLESDESTTVSAISPTTTKQVSEDNLYSSNTTESSLTKETDSGLTNQVVEEEVTESNAIPVTLGPILHSTSIKPEESDLSTPSLHTQEIEFTTSVEFTKSSDEISSTPVPDILFSTDKPLASDITTPNFLDITLSEVGQPISTLSTEVAVSLESDHTGRPESSSAETTTFSEIESSNITDNRFGTESSIVTPSNLDISTAQPQLSTIYAETSPEDITMTTIDFPSDKKPETDPTIVTDSSTFKPHSTGSQEVDLSSVTPTEPEEFVSLNTLLGIPTGSEAIENITPSQITIPSETEASTGTASEEPSASSEPDVEKISIPLEPTTLTPSSEVSEADSKTEMPSNENISESEELPPNKEILTTGRPEDVQENQKPIAPETQSNLPSSNSSGVPLPGEDSENQVPEPNFPGGYGQPTEDYDMQEEDQSFGPGTCRYGGKVFVSAQQIPRDDPCDFCFCFRSDIICLQQSCPPPIHGCHEEPIQGFCCPRYECPVSMATALNVTSTTTTTTTTLPPHFLPHAYKGAAVRRGCQIKGHSYQVGEYVRASSGPCLNCTCGGDGQMKCDPKVCTPEPMLRQMIAAAVSTKRRR